MLCFFVLVYLSPLSMIFITVLLETLFGERAETKEDAPADDQLNQEVDERDLKLELLQKKLAEQEEQLAARDHMLAKRESRIAELKASLQIKQTQDSEPQRTETSGVQEETNNLFSQSTDSAAQAKETSANYPTSSSVIMYGGRKIALSAPDTEEDEAFNMHSENENDDDQDESEDEEESEGSEEEQEDQVHDHLQRAEAIYDFTARNENEISFVKGGNLPYILRLHES